MKAYCLVILTSLLLAGCAGMQDNTPMRSDVAAKGVVPIRALPSPLPSGAVAIPSSQFILINADTAALALVDLLNPIPFVTDLAKDGMNQRIADSYQSRYAAVDPFAIATERLAGSPLLTGRKDALPLKPFVYMVEGSDGRWRLSLTFRIEGADWLGRFMVHLPTTYSAAEIRDDSTPTQQTLRQDLVDGSDVLRQLMERDARGQLKGDGTRVSFGSLHVVGSNAMGVLSAQRMIYTDAELLEEGADHVIIRSRGDMHADATNGALAFGVHYFRKNQLHHFVKTTQRAG